MMVRVGEAGLPSYKSKGWGTVLILLLRFTRHHEVGFRKDIEY